MFQIEVHPRPRKRPSYILPRPAVVPTNQTHSLKTFRNTMVIFYRPIPCFSILFSDLSGCLIHSVCESECACVFLVLYFRMIHRSWPSKTAPFTVHRSKIFNVFASLGYPHPEGHDGSIPATTICPLTALGGKERRDVIGWKTRRPWDSEIHVVYSQHGKARLVCLSPIGSFQVLGCSPF